MKQNLHPTLFPVCFLDISTGEKFFTLSTCKPKGSRTETHNGVEYSVWARDVTKASHTAFTGEKRFVDTAGRVQKFETRSRSRGKVTMSADQ